MGRQELSARNTEIKTFRRSNQAARFAVMGGGSRFGSLVWARVGPNICFQLTPWAARLTTSSRFARLCESRPELALTGAAEAWRSAAQIRTTGVPDMATLHLMVGLPCSGKTALARTLESACSALRLTPDEWQLRLFGQDAEESEHDARHSLIEALLWELASRALVLGTCPRITSAL